MREQIIARIRDIQAHLAELGAKREYINFSRLSDADLVTVEESLHEQLERRQKFLGENL